MVIVVVVCLCVFDLVDQDAGQEYPAQRLSLTLACAVRASRMKRGALIVLEGIDRCGKSTQCAKLVEHLKHQGIPAEAWAFPDRSTTLGQMVRERKKSLQTEDINSVLRRRGVNEYVRLWFRTAASNFVSALQSKMYFKKTDEPGIRL